jgi:PAS domain S-box-containing protein
VHGWLACRLHVTKMRCADERNLVETSHWSLSDMRAALDEHFLVAFTDARGRITFINIRLSEISQYISEEMIGRNHRIVNSGYHSKEFFRKLWQITSRGDVWEGKIRNPAKDGIFYWLATTISPFLNDEGRPHQFIVIRSDITVRKRIESELRSSRLFFHPRQSKFRLAKDLFGAERPDAREHLRSDGSPVGVIQSKELPHHLRRIRFKDPEKGEKAPQFGCLAKHIVTGIFSNLFPENHFKKAPFQCQAYPGG